MKSSLYRGKRGWHDACGPSAIGSSRHPRATWVATHVVLRLGCERHARESPEM